MAANYDPNDPESVKRYIQEQIDASSRQTESLSKTQKALESTYKGSINTLSSFNSTIMSTEKGLSKYGTIATQASNAISDLAGNFGPLGKAVGAAATSISALGVEALKQAERFSKGFDNLKDIGASARVTATQMYSFARAAGLTSFELESMTKSAKFASEGFVSIGGSVGAGFNKFGDILTKNIQGFRKLGFTTEEIVESQMMYIKQTAQFGVSLNRPVDMLRRSSEDYMKNLVILADLTGQDIKKQQAALDMAAADENLSQEMFNLSLQEQRLRKQGTADAIREADAIANRIDNMKTFTQGLAGYGNEFKTAMYQALASGGEVVGPLQAQLMSMGLDPAKYVKMLKAGADGAAVVAELQQDNAESMIRYSDQFGQSAAALGEGGKEISKAFLVDKERRQQAAIALGHTTKEQVEASKKGLAAQMNDRDTLMKRVADIEAGARQAINQLDDVIAQFNPFRNGMEDATQGFKAIAAAAAAAALGIGALGRTIGSRLPAPTTTGPTAGPGGRGAPGAPGGAGPQNPNTPTIRVRTPGGVYREVPNPDYVPPPAPPPEPTKGQKIKAGLGRVGRGVGGIGGAAMLGGYAVEQTTDVLNKAGVVSDKGSAVMNVLGSTLSGAGVGASLGMYSANPLVALGAGITGGLIGLGKGLMDNKEALFTTTDEIKSNTSQLNLGDKNQEILDRAAAERMAAYQTSIKENTEATNKNTAATTGAQPHPGAVAADTRAREEISATFTEADQADLDARVKKLNEFFAKNTMDKNGTLTWTSANAQKAYQQAYAEAQNLTTRKTQKATALAMLDKQAAAMAAQAQQEQEVTTFMEQLGTTEPAADLFSFGGNTGDLEHFNQLDAGFKQKLMMVASEYKQATGQKLNINSAYRSAEEQAALDPGSNPKAAPGHSKHQVGKAVDFNSEQVKKLDQLGILAKHGLRTLEGDPPHVFMAEGGIVSSPTNAIIGEGKGPEAVVPFERNSLLEKLAKTPAAAVESETSATISKMESTIKNILEMNAKTTNDYIGKLDRVINILESSHTTQEKLLRVSR